MKKLLLLLSLVTLVNCTKEKIVNVEKIVTEEVIVTNDYTLIAIAGEGGAITKSAASESSVTLTASANVGYIFTGWSSGSTDNPLTLNIGSDQTINAVFAEIKLQLSVTASEGGNVNITEGKYDKQATVSLVASPTDGYAFTGWTGGVTSADNPLSLVMDEAKTITANFEQTIDVSSQPDALFGNWSFGGNDSSSSKAECNSIEYCFS